MSIPQNLQKVKTDNIKSSGTNSKNMDIVATKTYNRIQEIYNNCIKGSADELRCIDYEVLKMAPANFFDKHSSIVKTLTSYIQTKIAESSNPSGGTVGGSISNSTMVLQAKRALNDDILRNQTYYIIHKFYIDFELEDKNPFYGKEVKKLLEMSQIDRLICFILSANEIIGLGPLDPIYRNPDIKEIICNGPFDIQAEDTEIRRIPSCKFRDRGHLTDFITKLYTSIGNEYGPTSPGNKARLKDNSRIFAVHDSVAPQGPNLNIRPHKEEWITPDKLVEWGAASPELIEWLGQMIHEGMSFVVNGGTSTGKSLSLDTPIPTPDGFKLLKDLQIGDYVFDKDGNPTKITNIFDNPKRKKYNVKFNNNATLGADLEHNWSVYNKNQGGNLETKTTGEILQSGLIKNKEKMFSIPKLSQPVKFNNAMNESEFSIHPYLMGIWLSNISDNIYQFNLSKRCGNHYDEMLRNFDSKYRLVKIGTGIFEVTNKESFEKDLKELNFCKRDGNILPKQYEFSSVNSRLLFIKGVFDELASTSKHTPGYFIKNKNYEFLSQIQRVLSSLGIFSKLKKDVVCGDITTNILSIVSFEKLVTIKDKSDNFDLEIIKFKNGKYNTPEFTERIAIDSIVSTDIEEEMRCLTVDSPSHTFLAGYEYNVTHNTTMLAALCGFIPNNKRIITIENNIEIKLPKNKLLAAAMETIKAKGTSEKATVVTMRDLVEYCTQMRPDSIICGEITGSETYDLLQASNTGHQAATSVHSNSSKECMTRLMSLTSQSELVKGKEALELIASGVDFIVSLQRNHHDLSRRIVEVSEVDTKITKDESGNLVLKTIPIWEFKQDMITDDTVKVTGHWEKVGELSDERRKMYRLDRITPKSLESLRELYLEYSEQLEKEDERK